MKKQIIAAIFFLTFLSPMVFAQGSSFWSGLYSVIFIISFIILLLAVGGVIHWPKIGKKGSNLGKWLGLLIFTILIFVLPYLVYDYLSAYFPSYTKVPESFKQVPLPSYAAKTLEALALPSDWMYVPAIIYLFIIPFTGVYVVVWAFLQSLGLFSNLKSSAKINRVIALLVTFLTIPIGWFVKLVWLMFAAMGLWSMIIFVAMFFVGVFFRGYSTVKKSYYESGIHTLSQINQQAKGEINAILNNQNLTENQLKSAVTSLYHRYGSLIPELNVFSPISVAGMSRDDILNRLREIAQKLPG